MAAYSFSTSASPPSRRPWLVLLLGMLLVLPGVASAQEIPPGAVTAPVSSGAVDIQVNLGFSDTVRLGHFAPVTVTLGNQGAPLTGHLEVVVGDGDPVLGGRFLTTHLRRVELPGGSRKRFRFTVFFEGFALPLVVRVVDGERVVAERSVDLRQRVTTARLLLVLSRDADLDALNDPRDGSLRVLYPHPDLLPDRWQGYDGVAAMLVHGVSLERLAADQFAALRTWVTRGGILAVSGGPDYSLLGTPRLAELLPGVPIGQVRVAPEAIADAGLDTLPFGAANVDVNQLARYVGNVLLGSSTLPLAIERRSGRGRVVYLAFDVAREPFRRWTGMRQLWLDLLRLPPVESLASQLVERPDDSPLQAFVAGTARPFPGRAPLFLFLVLYLGVLAVGYVQPADGRRRGWLLPVMTWVTPLVFAIAAHLLFGRVLFARQASGFVAGVIEPHEQGVNADLGLQVGWYANQRGDLPLEYDGVAPMFRPLRDGGFRDRPAEDWLVEDPPRGMLLPDSRRGYELHAVAGEDVVAFDLEARLTLTDEGPGIVVRNHSGRPVVDAWLVYHGAAYPLGTIPEGAGWSRIVDPLADAVRFDDEPWFDVLRRSGVGDTTGASAESRLLAHAILQARREPNPPPDQALFVGQVHSPFRLAGASASWPRRELVLLIATMPVALREHGRRAR